MKKTTIVQFVCFVTNLEADDFAPKWERYAKKLIDYSAETTILQQVETKGKYRYLSQHDWQDRDLHFSFMNDRKSEHFPEHNVKVVQIGGYTLLQTEPVQISHEHFARDAWFSTRVSEFSRRTVLFFFDH